ncbi:MAG: ATP-dependent DNA helicase [Isosphaeraceae bacterium]|nr:ATP-dependent DNA helicase [Isosphaeraceae bacterium]
MDDELPRDGLDPEPILGAAGAIARRLHAFEPRPQQLEMARAVARAVEGEHHLMVEAGTGVGKSFAYLVPAVMAAVRLGKKVVVSTHTISLQEQLIQKDIPFLRAVMPEEFTAVLVKGRSNYISLRRLDHAVRKADSLFPRIEEHEQLGKIAQWAKTTGDGSRSDLDFAPVGSVWEAIGSDQSNCLGKSCPRHKECFYYAARRRMNTANLLVVNHALFLTDLALRAGGGGMLPKYDVAIFDEAHTLEEVAAEHLGISLTSGRIEFWLNRLYNPKTDKGILVDAVSPPTLDLVQRARVAATSFFQQLAGRAGVASANGRLRKPIGLSDTLGEEFRKLATAISNDAEMHERPEDRIELDSAAGRCDAIAADLASWLDQDRTDSVYWIEQEKKRQPTVSLHCAPLDVGPILRTELFDRTPTCILTSATLCVGKPPKFDFLQRRLGLTKCSTLQLGSPFDYDRQVTLHLVKDLPDPSQSPKDFEDAAIRAIPRYLELTNGGAFVLFTSHRMLEQAARTLAPWFAERNIRLYAQSDGLPRSKMVEAFKQDVESVLFGAESFWQGVDVAGDSLRNVIIVKLPFSVPDHPLLEARLEEIRRLGGIPFRDYQLPQAIIRLKQGFGRLIRTKTDSGHVVILDPRVSNKSYGREFLDSLPPCPRRIDVLDSGRAPR